MLIKVGLSLLSKLLKLPCSFANAPFCPEAVLSYFLEVTIASAVEMT